MVFFKRSGRYYILTGSGCCACKGGSSIDVFVASAPLGPYQYLGDVGSVPGHAYDPHSPRNFVTRAQGSAMFVLPAADQSAEPQFVWLGNQVGSGIVPVQQMVGLCLSASDVSLV